ncbi:MAG: Ribose-phosphate pyrophosphokinase [Candidatus Anoxychlamydiales bacterium]|nr:Ribose-phosphate pyrophosphokinase [Candidatus Anoxychlamydiales bacterium]
MCRLKEKLMQNFLKLFLVIFLFIFSQVFCIDKDIDKDSFRLFAGNSNPDLAMEVASILGIDINEAEVGRFHDGEIKIKINDNVKGKDIYILQSVCTTKNASVNDNLMELYLLIRACKRSSAKRIIAVIPYLGYARQDRKHSEICPISASDIAMLLETAGADHIISLDMHSFQIQGFYHKSIVDNLMTNFFFVPYFVRKDISKVVVVASHAGAIARSRKFIDGLNRYNIDSRLVVFTMLPQKNSKDEMFLIGDVKDTDVLIVNDMCDTGKSVVAAAKELKRNGAKKIYACATHGIFSHDAIDKIKNSDIDELIITDTIPLREEAPNNLTQISIAPLIAAAIKKTQRGEPLSNLFQY